MTSVIEHDRAGLQAHISLTLSQKCCEMLIYISFFFVFNFKLKKSSQMAVSFCLLLYT